MKPPHLATITQNWHNHLIKKFTVYIMCYMYIITIISDLDGDDVVNMPIYTPGLFAYMILFFYHFKITDDDGEDVADGAIYICWGRRTRKHCPHV